MAGEIADTANSDVIVMCASIPMPPEMKDRSVLGPGNVKLMQDLLPPLAKLSPAAVLVMVSNPVDTLTYYGIEFTGFAWQRVIGTGTLIDSLRLRHELSLEVGIHNQDLRAYILGEHGKAQFAAMSCATAGGEPIDDSPARRKLISRVSHSGLDILHNKGYTNYGIALAAALIVETVIQDTKHTIPVSVALDGYLGIEDVCLSLPCVIGRDGVERILHPKLNDEEALAFRKCAAQVRRRIKSLRPRDLLREE
jgi:L-lactate dehydrogenase